MCKKMKKMIYVCLNIPSISRTACDKCFIALKKQLACKVSHLSVFICTLLCPILKSNSAVFPFFLVCFCEK